MKFLIRKSSSSYYDTKKPCVKAYSEEIKERNEIHLKWFIDLENFDELKKFIKKIDNDVIISIIPKQKYMKLEIYDDCRE